VKKRGGSAGRKKGWVTKTTDGAENLLHLLRIAHSEALRRWGQGTTRRRRKGGSIHPSRTVRSGIKLCQARRGVLNRQATEGQRHRTRSQTLDGAVPRLLRGRVARRGRNRKNEPSKRKGKGGLAPGSDASQKDMQGAERTEKKGKTLSDCHRGKKKKRKNAENVEIARGNVWGGSKRNGPTGKR